MNKKISFWLFLTTSIAFNSVHAEKEIAITIDDLPFVGTNSHDPGNLRRSHERFMNMLQFLVDQHVPATGFVIAGAIGTGQWELLKAFRDQGLTIGNHTYSHANLNRMSAEKYIDNINKADQVLSPIISTPKYFRYPYLAEGNGDKKQTVHQYLENNHYTIAPVTIDTKDFALNQRLLHIPWRVRSQYYGQIKRQYLSSVWHQTERAEKRCHHEQCKQILLIHANLLNSLFLGDLIQMYKDHGYRFITLEEALTNTAAPAMKNELSANFIEDPSWFSDMEKSW